MFTSTILAGFTALFCSSFSLVDARIMQRDVVSPPITYPTTGTVWNVNDRHNVTWDTSVIPPGITNNGMIVLGFLDSADGINEHLDLNHPLATGFPITAGRAEITVPAVTTRDSYILVLFGDSGNASGKFTINNISISASPPSTPSSVTASSSASSTTSTSTTDAPGSAQGSSTPSSSDATSSTQSAVVSESTTGSAATSSATAAAHLSSIAPASSASVASGASSSAPTTEAQPTAQSATSPNAGVRSAPHGGAAAWISTMFSLALVVGFAL